MLGASYVLDRTGQLIIVIPLGLQHPLGKECNGRENAGLVLLLRYSSSAVIEWKRSRKSSGNNGLDSSGIANRLGRARHVRGPLNEIFDKPFHRHLDHSFVLEVEGHTYVI